MDSEFTVLQLTLEELKYAEKLNKIYKNFIKPIYEFLKFYNISIGSHDRSFKIISNSFNNDSFWGTQKSFERTYSHDRVFFHTSPGPSYIIPKNMAEIAHFREDEYTFAKVSPITHLIIDLNYINCYYFDILNEFSPNLGNIAKNLWFENRII